MSNDADAGAVQPADLNQILRQRLPGLEDVAAERRPQTQHCVAEALAILVELLGKIEATLLSQLELLAKQDGDIKALLETVRKQGLLNAMGALQAVLKSGDPRAKPLKHYSDLLMRWWSAALTGAQTTVLEVPDELGKALNPGGWAVEKKRWSAEEEAFWNHYQHVIRHDLPLQFGDRLKKIQAAKTLDAYRIMGGER